MLGFHLASQADTDDELLPTAIAAFQAFHKLKLTGKIDKATTDKLVERIGR